MENGFFGSSWKTPEWDSTKDKVFKKIWQMEQSPENGKTLLLEKGLPGSSWVRVRRELAAHPIHSLLVDGTARPRQIPSYWKGLSKTTPHRAGDSGLALGGICVGEHRQILSVLH